MKDYNIVVVDDEELVTSNLAILLKMEGYQSANIFNSPLEALEYMQNNRVDLVISDFFMPEMNGIQLLRKTRELNPGAVLILLTGYADKESAIKAINEIGLYRYIEKPWDNDDLLLCIRNGLEKTHLSAIINHSADGIITISEDGTVLHANPAFHRMVGPVQNISEVFFSRNNKPVSLQFDPEKDVLVRDCRLKCRISGKLIPVEISFAPVVGGTNYYIGIIRDVTAGQEMERLRDDFTATLAHDLRTPLLAAIQTLQFFVDGSLGNLSEKQKVLLETMMYSNQDMLGLVNALLEVYRYESGQLSLRKENFALSETIGQCIREIKPLAESKGIQINFNSISDEKICADKHELKRVLANFLGNAVKHTDQGGIISISAYFGDEEVTVSVEDNGTGIPEEDLPRLFNRFSQGTNKKRSTSTGLGLYLSRQIIEAHSGKIWVESELNHGSRFKFSIPKEKIHAKQGI